MKKENKITVITVTLNCEKTIERTIQSVKSQTYPQLEYIVIDGRSSDDTIKIVNKYQENIDYFSSSKDSGVYDAMNKGITKATGDVLFFLNSDDRFADSEVVRDVAAIFAASGDTDFIYGNAILEYPESCARWMPHPELSRRRLAMGTICHQAIFVKRHVMELTNGFSEDYRVVSDYAWLLELVHEHQFVYRYMDRDIAIIGTDGLSRTTVWEQERIQVMKRYYSPLEIWLWRTLPRTLKSCVNRAKHSVRKLLPSDT